MKTEPNIIKKFKESVIKYFSSEAEFELFLNRPEHYWGSPNKAPHQPYSPKQWLLRSRRSDRLEYAVRTVEQLKTSIVIPS